MPSGGRSAGKGRSGSACAQMPSTPMGSRTSAFDHIGFFFELTHADVSGLGADEKLHVGDFNWAAGVNFEF